MIEPIPIEELPPSSRAIIETCVGRGLYATPLPLQVFAYCTPLLESVHDKRLAAGQGSLLGGRLLELLRIRSAWLGGCQPCRWSRTHDPITDDGCLAGDDRTDLGPQEWMALRFLDLLSADHHAIDADFYRALGEVFTTAQIVELGFTCAELLGVHRFVHTLDIFGSDPPALPYSADQIDARRAADRPTGSDT